MKSTIQPRRHEPKARLAARWTLLACLAAAALTGGCVNEREYRFIAPDTAAATAAATPVAARLLRAEILGFESTVKNQPVVIALVPGEQHAAFTDRGGYASVIVTLPEEPGAYPLTLTYQDLNGVQAAGIGTSWAVDPAAGALLVDMRVAERPAEARRLREIAGSGGAPQIVYALAAKDMKDPQQLHQRLDDADLPDGPVLSWAVEDGRLVGPLAGLAESVKALACLPSPDKEFNRLVALLGLEPRADDPKDEPAR